MEQEPTAGQVEVLLESLCRINGSVDLAFSRQPCYVISLGSFLDLLEQLNRSHS